MFRSRKSVHIFLATVSFYTLFLKSLSTTQHGGDTWVMYLRCQAIIVEGYIPWFIDATSFFGWYPFSYPSGSLVLISGLSIVTGLNMDTIVLFWPLVVGILSIYSIFIFSRLFGTNFFALVTVAVYSTFFISIMSTWHTIFSRGLFVSIYPLVLFLYFRTSSNFQTSNFLSCILTTIALASIHRIFYYFVIVLLLPFLCVLLYKRIVGSRLGQIRKKYFLLFYVSLLILSFYIAWIGPFQEQMVRRDRGYSLLDNTNALFIILNLISTYLIEYNFIIFLFPIGLYYVISKQVYFTTDRFLVIVSIISFAFIFDIQYFKSFFTPCISLITAMSLIKSKKFLLQNNFRVIGISVIIFLFQLQYVKWFFESSYFIPIVITILSFTLIFFSLIKIINKKKESTLMPLYVAIILMTISYNLSYTIYRSIDQENQFDEGYGDLHSELISYNHGLWQKEYNDGNIFPIGSLCNPLIAISESKTIGRSTYLLENEVFITEVQDTEFLSLDYFVVTRRFFVDVDYPYDRYYPRGAFYLILNGDMDLARSYEVETFIIPIDPDEMYMVDTDIEGEQVLNEAVAYNQENRYVIYEDELLHINKF